MDSLQLEIANQAFVMGFPVRFGLVPGVFDCNTWCFHLQANKGALKCVKCVLGSLRLSLSLRVLKLRLRLLDTSKLSDITSSLNVASSWLSGPVTLAVIGLVGCRPGSCYRKVCWQESTPLAGFSLSSRG